MRKQILLGTTALMVGAIVAPGFAAAEEMPLRLEVGGYYYDYFGIGDVDDNPVAPAAARDLGNTNLFNDGEIFFQGETTLDNGLTFGVHVELETNQPSDQIDQAYSYVSGDFGMVEIGSNNLANYNTFWSVVAPNVGVPINSGWTTVFTPIPSGFGSAGTFLSPLLTTNLDIGNDEAQISYYSPRFAGFQFTGGYAPAVAETGDGQITVANEGTQYHNAFGVGLNFSNEFNGVSLGFDAGYNRGSVDTTREAAGVDDFEQVKVGASIGFAGFTIAGSYANQLVGKTDAANTLSNKGEAYDVGAKYATGPWAASVAYYHGEQQDTIAIPGDDEMDSFVGAVSYAVGPGITTSLSIYYGKHEDESGANGESTLGILGLALNF